MSAKVDVKAIEQEALKKMPSMRGANRKKATKKSSFSDSSSDAEPKVAARRPITPTRAKNTGYN